MKSWLVLNSPDKPIAVVDAPNADQACIDVARERNAPGNYLAVEWNPKVVTVERNVSENWGVA